MIIRGKVWRIGDNVNTDLIIAGKYKLSITNINELSKHAMEALIPGFAEKVNKGDIIVAGKNFGCGSSREQAPLVLKHIGIGAVVAKSFARIFYRNAINIGLPAIECRDVDKIMDKDMLEIDLVKGSIKNLARNEAYEIKPIPSALLEVLISGGLVNYVRKHGRLPW